MRFKACVNFDHWQAVCVDLKEAPIWSTNNTHFEFWELGFFTSNGFVGTPNTLPTLSQIQNTVMQNGTFYNAVVHFRLMFQKFELFRSRKATRTCQDVLSVLFDSLNKTRFSDESQNANFGEDTDTIHKPVSIRHSSFSQNVTKGYSVRFSYPQKNALNVWDNAQFFDFNRFSEVFFSKQTLIRLFLGAAIQKQSQWNLW